MSNIFPAITLYQPWATWIMRGWKTIETRTHARFASLEDKTILIHSGQRTDDSDAVISTPYLTARQILQDPDEVINGFILGSAFVSKHMELNESHSQNALIDCASVKRYGLFLEQITKFENPIPVKGEMGIWYFDMDKKVKVKKSA